MKYEEDWFKDSVKQLVTLVTLITRQVIRRQEFTSASLPWYTKVLEKTVIKKQLSGMKANLNVPISYDRELVGFLAFLMENRGLSFESAYDKLFMNEYNDIDGPIYYITFLGHYDVEIIECEDCDGGTVVCDDCAGQGEIECPKCQGSGSTDCEECNGGEEDCDKCNNGDVDCEEDTCNYGQVECPSCSGYSSVECDRCEGESFEKSVANFKYEIYTMLFDSIDEHPGLKEVLSTNITPEELESFCDRQTPKIDYTYLRGGDAGVESEYKDTKWEDYIVAEGFEFETEKMMLIMNGFEHIEGQSEVEEYLQQIF